MPELIEAIQLLTNAAQSAAGPGSEALLVSANGTLYLVVATIGSLGALGVAYKIKRFVGGGWRDSDINGR